MLLTENEAKDKWCPQVRAAADVEDGNACNAGVAGLRVPFYSCCIGSGCMMWRWSAPVHRRVITTATGDDLSDPGRPPTVPDSWVFCPADDDPACWVVS